jgi:hypothetical protein
MVTPDGVIAARVDGLVSVDEFLGELAKGRAAPRRDEPGCAGPGC